jgi:hypothetical protein
MIVEDYSKTERRETRRRRKKMRIRHTDWWQLEKEKRYIILPMRGKKRRKLLAM